MKKIRHGVFETNSSSTHSISISEDNSEALMDTSLVPDEDGNVILQGGEFGWGPEIYNDAQSKASYLAVLLDDSSDPEYLKQKEILIDIIKKQTGCIKVVFDFSNYWDKRNYSYIDHGDEHGIRDEVFESKDILRQFIFNTQSELEIDNDNY